MFPGLKVNHIVDINFGGFTDLVNAIGCVYTDVDHRYYNNTAVTNYSSIDIQPGYQKLCGTDALAFVRFRHTDSDLVRNARQQDFIRWAKDQYGAGNLIANRDRLLRIFGAHTETDHNLHTVDGLINLFNLVAFSAGHSIKQIKFPAHRVAVRGHRSRRRGHALLRDRHVAGRGGGVPRLHATDDDQRRSAKPALKKNDHNKPNHVATAGLIADVSDGKAQAAAVAKIGMPIYYPRLIVNQSSYCSGDDRQLPVRDPHDRLLSARLHASRPARQSVPGLPHDAGHEPGPGAVLRGAGHRLAEPADPQQPHSNARRGWQEADAVRRRRQAHRRRLAHVSGGLLDLQHADYGHRQPADGGDRRLADPGWRMRQARRA